MGPIFRYATSILTMITPLVSCCRCATPISRPIAFIPPCTSIINAFLVLHRSIVGLLMLASTNVVSHDCVGGNMQQPSLFVLLSLTLKPVVPLMYGAPWIVSHVFPFYALFQFFLGLFFRCFRGPFF
jgi:hypothetical protein